MRKFHFRVVWSREDAEYVGLCREFPSLSWLAASEAEALQGIERLVADVLEDMKINGEPLPVSRPA
jgi:predicted RNase H-like HicB family nuclease